MTRGSINCSLKPLSLLLMKSFYRYPHAPLNNEWLRVSASIELQWTALQSVIFVVAVGIALSHTFDLPGG
jgi:hypothetical protein